MTRRLNQQTVWCAHRPKGLGEEEQVDIGTVQVRLRDFKSLKMQSWLSSMIAREVKGICSCCPNASKATFWCRRFFPLHQTSTPKMLKCIHSLPPVCKAFGKSTYAHSANDQAMLLRGIESSVTG